MVTAQDMCSPRIRTLPFMAADELLHQGRDVGYTMVGEARFVGVPRHCGSFTWLNHAFAVSGVVMKSCYSLHAFSSNYLASGVSLVPGVPRSCWFNHVASSQHTFLTRSL
jgi:hypothetical protein